MSLGLTNARISGHSTAKLKVQKVTPARTSIAEDAKFVPKPHKRVSFKLSTSSTKLGGGSGIGDGLKAGDLGSHGISANSNKVSMEINVNPEKDFTVIAPQEEGRQTNNAQTTHFSQQYDSYGRPRIGFSREPYDFAATKYMAITSEIKFQENMEATVQGYNSYLMDPTEKAGEVKTEDANLLVPASTLKDDADKVKAADVKLIVENATAKKGMINLDEEKGEVKFLGEGNSSEQGMVEAASAKKAETGSTPKEVEAAPVVEATGQSATEVAEKMGIDVKDIMRPENASEVAKAHDLTDVAKPSGISVSA